MDNQRNESAQGSGETKLWKKASTKVVNPRPGQPAKCSSLYDQQSSRDQQQRYAPPPSYTPHTQPPPGSVQQEYSAQPLAYGYATGQQVIVQAPPPLPAVTDASSQYWLVLGILTAIFLCLPLGVAGAVMAYLSGKEAKRGNFVAYNRKLGHSKVLTLLGLGVGSAIYAIVIIVAVRFPWMHPFYW